MEVYTCDSVSYVICRNLAFLMLDLVTTYLDAEGQGKNKSFTSKGKKQVIKKTVDNKQKTAYKLTPNDGDAPVYFVVVNDTTLRLVNDSLQEAVSDLNYDIIQVKK